MLSNNGLYSRLELGTEGRQESHGQNLERAIWDQSNRSAPSAMFSVSRC